VEEEEEEGLPLSISKVISQKLKGKKIAIVLNKYIISLKSWGLVRIYLFLKIFLFSPRLHLFDQKIQQQ